MLVRLEMDEKRMTMAWFSGMPAWVAVAAVAAHLGAGFALGMLYFRSLWWSVNRLAGRGNLARLILPMIGRFLGIGAVLTLAALEGAWPLLAMATGVLVARVVILRRVREAAP
jgi:hypothetical protein